MKTKRIVLGVISCFLLAVGLARAADRLDPMTVSLQSSLDTLNAGQATPGCTDPCEPCFPCDVIPN